jgi:oligopeptidase A
LSDIFPEFTQGDIDAQVKSVKKIVSRNKKLIKELLTIKKKNFQNFVLPFLELEEALGFEFQPISHINGVKNSKKTQKAIKELLPILSEYSTKISQNEELYSALKSAYECDGTLSDEAKMALKLELQDFENDGVGKPKSVKKRIEEINTRLGSLENDFSQNVLDDTNSFEMIVTDEAAVAELPAIEKEQAKVKKDGKNVYRFTLHQPSFVAFMTYGTDRAKREELYKAYVTRGAKNGALMEEILALRDEKAKLLGYKNYCEHSIAVKSAPSPEAVNEFLLSLAKETKHFAQDDYVQLKAFAAAHGCENLESFDNAYYTEQLRKELFDIDEEHLKNYFESGATVNGMFSFVEKIFGVSFKKANTKTWHKKATAYDLYEKGALIGRLFVDLEARKSKKGGAWMDNWTSGSITPKGSNRLPIAYITCNFAPSSKTTPSLLRHNDVETLFHEMGHALHHLLAKNTICSVSGVNGVLWDVVEFPSQFLENFAYEKSVLELFAKHYQTGEMLPESEIQKLQKAKNFQAAMGVVRQLELGLFDMRIHSQAMNEDEVRETIDEVRKEVAVITPPAYNKFQNSFTHIFGGSYAAGYYSYKWAEVLSADAYMEFSDKGVFDGELGKKMRESVFAQGGAVDMNKLFHEFAGRDVDSSSLLRLYGLSK